MPDILNVKPEEPAANEKRSKFLVSVVGCGQKGILYVKALVQAGFQVACIDTDPTVVKKLAKGKTPFAEQETESKIKHLINTGQLNVSSDLNKLVSQSNVVIVTIPAKVDDKKKIDTSEALNVLKKVGAALQAGTLVIYSEVAGLGFVDGTIKEILENTSGLKAGQGFGLAYVPINNSKVKVTESIDELQLKVALVGETNPASTLNFLKTINKNVKQISDIKTAEIAALFTSAKQDVNAALASELAIFCENANVDYFEVAELSELNELSFLPTITHEESKNEAYLLLESGEVLNAKLRLSTLARQINEQMVKHAVNLTQDALRSCDKTLRRARVAVLANAKLGTGTIEFIKLLETKGAKASLFGPASKCDALGLGVVKTSLNEALEGADCIVILTAEEQFKHLNLRKLKALTKKPSLIVDLAGALDRQKVESEGFVYHGIGKGVGEK